MKQIILGLMTMMSVSAFAITQKTIDLGEGRFKTITPIHSLLPREAAYDTVYFSPSYSDEKLCQRLGYSEYEVGSKVVESTRAITTRNLWLNKIGYAIYPIGRLSEGYQYPKAKRVKEIVCTTNN
jgi:hypothetical protein